MKRFATMALAATTLVAGLVTPEIASAQNWRHDGGRDRGDRHDRGDRNDRRDGRWDGRGRDDNRGWDRSRHNGYTYNGRWNYGPAPREYWGRPGYYAGYRDWRRGDRLPSYYRDHYYGVDYRAYRLRPPPYGYRWVRGDRGEFLLVGIATGVILSSIFNNY